MGLAVTSALAEGSTEGSGDGAADVSGDGSVDEGDGGAGAPDEAAAALEGAIAASGGNWMPWNHDAWVGLARADPVAGLAKVRACADQMSGAAGSGLLGDALAATVLTAEARAAYDRAIEIEPDSTVWRTRRAALR